MGHYETLREHGPDVSEAVGVLYRVWCIVGDAFDAYAKLYGLKLEHSPCLGRVVYVGKTTQTKEHNDNG